VPQKSAKKKPAYESQSGEKGVLVSQQKGGGKEKDERKKKGKKGSPFLPLTHA